jgi:hypothetical protein
MFDIWQIAAHALWIFGLAVLLAVWSFGYYEGQQSGESVLKILSQPNYDLAVIIGLVLFFAGLVGADGRIWAKIIWGVFIVAVIGLFIYRRRFIQE